MVKKFCQPKKIVHGGFIENIEGNQFEMCLNPRLHDNKIWLSTEYEDYTKEQKVLEIVQQKLNLIFSCWC